MPPPVYLPSGADGKICMSLHEFMFQPFFSSPRMFAWLATFVRTAETADGLQFRRRRRATTTKDSNPSVAEGRRKKPFLTLFSHNKKDENGENMTVFISRLFSASGVFSAEAEEKNYKGKKSSTFSLRPSVRVRSNSVFSPPGFFSRNFLLQRDSEKKKKKISNKDQLGESLYKRNNERLLR